MGRLPFLLLMLLGIIVLAYIPALIERIQYSRTKGELRALREALPEMNLQSLSKAFSLVYRKVKPSVVHVSAHRTVRVNLPAAFFNGRTPTVDERIDASGVIVDSEGYIVTNYHAVQGTDEVKVSLDDGRAFAATKIGGDPAVDLAVLKIDGNDLVAAQFGDSDKLEVGELVWAIGNPFGLDQTVTAGIVSAKERHNIGPSPNVFQEFLQTDAAVNPGNSGGPLVDIAGEVVGINTAIIGNRFQGVSFAIPSNLVRDIYKEIRENGKVVRGDLAVGFINLTPQIAAQLSLPADITGGAVVVQLTPDGAGQKAGLRYADVLIDYNGQPVTDRNQLILLIARTPVGTKVPIRIVRDGREMTIDATIAEAPTQSM